MSTYAAVQGTSFIQRLQAGPRQVTIFGREPTVIMNFLESGLGALTAFGIAAKWGFTQETYGIWIMVIEALFGFIVAFLTRDTLLGVSVGLVKALIAAVSIYGLTLTDQQVGSILTLVPVFIMLWQRTQTAPIVNGQVIPRGAKPGEVPEIVAPAVVTTDVPAEVVEAPVDPPLEGGDI